MEDWRNIRDIEAGDRIYARLTMRNRCIVETVFIRVADFSELLAELRRNAGSVNGLASLYVRNLSKGWSFERPLKLYAGTFAAPREKATHIAPPAPEPERRIFAPWEFNM